MEDANVESVNKNHITQFKLLIFDFDYTLVNSANGNIKSINYALQKLGFLPASEGEICKTVGLSLRQAFEKLTGKQNASMVNKFIELYIKKADEVMVNSTIVSKTVQETIQTLKKHGIALAIFSSQSRNIIEKILSHKNLLQHFDIIIGWYEVSKPKPNPEGLFTICQKLNILPKYTMYVGDNATDAETARRAGIPFVAVLSGVTSREDFSNYPVYGVIENVSELPKLIAKSKIA